MITAMNRNEIKKFFVDISARVAQVVVTLLVITPFIANIFSWPLFLAGVLIFLLITLIGASIAGLIEEEKNEQ